jgi:PAT family beta-lactamase induction signal transducer AmpG
MFEPRTMLGWIGAVALATVFFSASQDIVVDAYRTDLLPPAQRASGTAIFVAAYRVASTVATAGALALSDFVPWPVVFYALAALMGVGLVTTLLAPEPVTPAPPRTLAEAVWKPLVEFFRRKGARTALVFLAIILLYKLGDTLSTVLQTPFLLRLGFSRTEVGAFVKVLSLAVILGAFIGGGVVARYGLKRSLIAFGIAQALGNLGYVVLAIVGKSYTVMFIAIGTDYLVNGMGTAAFVALLMSLCNKKFTAFQYALFSSLSSLIGHVAGGASGWIAEEIGWPAFFASTLVAAVPGIVLLAITRIDEGEDA